MEGKFTLANAKNDNDIKTASYDCSNEVTWYILTLFPSM